MTPTQNLPDELSEKRELDLIHDAMVLLGVLKIGQCANQETRELAQRILRLRPTSDPWKLAGYLSDFFHLKVPPADPS